MGIALSRTVSKMAGYNQIAFIIMGVNCQMMEASLMVTKPLNRHFDSRVVKFAPLATFIALIVGTSCLAAEPVAAELPAQVAKKVAMQTKLVQQLWKGQGNVIVGKLDMPPGVDRQQIASRTLLLNDGWFAARLFPGRTLSVRAHGYKSVDIQPPEGA